MGYFTSRINDMLALQAWDYTPGPAPSGWLTPTAASYSYDALGGEGRDAGGGALFTSFASIVWVQTTGQELELEQFSNNSEKSWLGVYDGASYLRVPAATTLGVVESRALTVPGTGSRVVGISIGSQQRSGVQIGLDRTGTWLKRLRFTDDPNATLVGAAPAGTLIYVEGDSITVGIDTTEPQRDGWIPALRQRLPDSYTVVSDGYGYRSNTETLPNEASVDQSVARFTYAARSATRAIYYLELGVNDFRDDRDLLNITDTLLPNLFNKLRLAVPSVEIYLQTPLLYTEGQANKATQPYTLAQMRDAYAACAAKDGNISLVQGPLLLPGNSDLHPGDSGNATIAANVSARLMPVDYNATPEGDASAVPTPLNGSSQKIVIQGGNYDMSDGWTAIIQERVTAGDSGLSHLFAAGDYNGVCGFRLFRGGEAVAFNNLSGSSPEYATGPAQAVGNYITYGFYASPAGTGVVSSLGASLTGPGVTPVGNFDGFSVGALKQGSSYGFFSDRTMSNVSFHTRVIPLADLQAIVNANGLLTKAQYDDPTCVLFSSLKRASAGATTMLNLAQPGNSITLQ